MWKLVLYLYTMQMKYTANYKWEELEFNYEPNYEPLDFIRNNDTVDLFKNENGKVLIDYELVIKLMSECYKDLLTKNYL
jgi:hypothetical protein